MVWFTSSLDSLGLLKDGSKVLRDLNITNGCKMMVVGSTINDVLKVTPPAPSQLKEEKGATGRYCRVVIEILLLYLGLGKDGLLDVQDSDVF
jgi:hypothetical protein